MQAQNSEDEFSQAERSSDAQRDVNEDMGDYLGPPPDFNLEHLTLSETALTFFFRDPNLRKLLPLIDQIVSTNHLDDRKIDLYRSMVTSQIIDLQLDMDEDDPTSFIKLNTARTYMFLLLDGCKGGYRGKLATEVRRIYRTETNQNQSKRRWFR